MKKSFFRFCAAFLIPMMALLNCPITAASSPIADIEIEHDPVEETTAGQRIDIEVKIKDESGIKNARVYFKAIEASDYTFIILASDNGETFTGTLPAPANGAGTIEYLILVQNGNDQVVKTQTYQVAVEDDDDAAGAVAQNEQIQVYTELEEVPAEVTGFSDNIAIDVVESAVKLGVVAGLYSTVTAGSSSSGATAAGTVAATTGGISGTAIVLGTVVAAAAVGGAAALASSSDGDDDGGSSEALTSRTIVGTWNVVENGVSFTVTFNSNGTYTVNPGLPGNWVLSGSSLTMTQSTTGNVWSGTVSGDSKSFTMSGPTTAYFSR